MRRQRWCVVGRPRCCGGGSIGPGTGSAVLRARRRTGKHRRLGPLDVCQQEVDPFEREVTDETINGHLSRRMRLVIALPGQRHLHVVFAADGRLQDGRIHAVQVEVCRPTARLIGSGSSMMRRADGILCLAQIQ